jgi:multiple sugar transport system substrate-binding protein
VASDPMLATALAAASKAENLFPTAPAAQLGYAQIAKLVGEGGIRLVNTETPTEQILKQLQDELERRVPLK